MPQAHNDNITIQYQTFGDPSNPTLLLIAGLANQMTAWHHDFCSEIAQNNLHVIRFDNRDTGLSTNFDHYHFTNIPAIIHASQNNHHINPPYSLNDMAKDALAVLDSLNITSAHILGTSLGSIIAQTIALDTPHRTQSLTLIMSSARDLLTQQSLSRTQASFLATSPATQHSTTHSTQHADRDQYIKHTIRRAQSLASPNAPFDYDYARSRIEHAYDRSHNQGSRTRQFTAMLTSAPVLSDLKNITTPTLIIHGHDDPLLPPSHAIQLANTIPNSQLEIIPDMGHELPPRLWPNIIDQIINHLSVTTWHA